MNARPRARGERWYLIALAILALLVIRVSFMYNHNAYDPLSASCMQSALYLAPLACIALRVRREGGRHLFLLTFFALAFLLVGAGGLRIDNDGWVYLVLLGLPLFWLAGLYALISLPKRDQ